MEDSFFLRILLTKIALLWMFFNLLSIIFPFDMCIHMWKQLSELDVYVYPYYLFQKCQSTFFCEFSCCSGKIFWGGFFVDFIIRDHIQ